MKSFLLGVLLLALAGCGEKGIEYGAYSIGRDQSWFPLQIAWRAPNLNAFTNALVQEIAKKEDVPLQIINISWEQLFQLLEEKEVGGIFTSLSPNVITQAKYTFSDPFLLLGPVLIVPFDSQATSLLDLAGKIVAVNQFDESILIAQRYPSIMIELYENMPAVLEKLNGGQIDGVLMPVLEAQALVPHLYPSRLKIVTAPLSNKALRLITLKGANKALMKHFNQGLEWLLSSGKYAALRETYQLN
jgi:polar amino acid transport system substrate-binding protein